MTVTMRAELIEQAPSGELWEVVQLDEVKEGDVVSFDLAALAERRRESVPRVDWTEVFAEAVAVAAREDLGLRPVLVGRGRWDGGEFAAVRADEGGWVLLHTYDLAADLVGGPPDMEVLRLAD